MLSQFNDFFLFLNTFAKTEFFVKMHALTESGEVATSCLALHDQCL